MSQDQNPKENQNQSSNSLNLQLGDLTHRVSILERSNNHHTSTISEHINEQQFRINTLERLAEEQRKEIYQLQADIERLQIQVARLTNMSEAAMESIIILGGDDEEEKSKLKEIIKCTAKIRKHLQEIFSPTKRSDTNRETKEEKDSRTPS